MGDDLRDEDPEDVERLIETPSTELPDPLPAQGPDMAALPVENRALLTVGVMAATLMVVLDSTIANVALPHMQAALGATSDTITWVLTSYIVAFAVAIPMTGWLSDTIGSRNLFIGCVVGFVLSSMLCGMATGIGEMVAFRILQGIFGAFLNPLSQTVMLDINRPSKQASAMSIWGIGIMFGPVLGPIIGGWLTDNYSWRWVFYINVPVGILCFFILWALLPSRQMNERRFDLFGFITLAVAISAFQLMLDRGETKDWFSSWEVWLEGMIALGSAWMFLIHMLTTNNPLFERAMFRNVNLLTGIVLMIVQGLLSMAVLALIPSMLQQLYGYPVFTAGILLMPRGVGIMLMMWGAGRLLAAGADPRLLICIGLLILAETLRRMTGWDLAMDSRPFLVIGFLQGLGTGLIFLPLNTMGFATLSPAFRTDGASALNLSRNLGGSVGISLVTVVLAQNVQTNHQMIGSHIHDLGLVAADPVVTSALGGVTDPLLSMANAVVNQQAAMIAYIDDFKLLMFMTLGTLPLLLFLKRPKKRDADEDPIHLALE